MTSFLPRLNTGERQPRRRSGSKATPLDGRNPIIFPENYGHYPTAHRCSNVAKFSTNTPALGRAFAHATLPLVHTLIPPNAAHAHFTLCYCHPGASKPYTPARLCAAIAQSSNATDHLIRIHITSMSYYSISQSSNESHEFILFEVEDTAIPGLKNLVILDHDDQDATNTPISPSRYGGGRLLYSSVGMLDSLIPSYLKSSSPHGRFYISENGMKSGLPEPFKHIHEPQHTRPIERVSFPLESLLVLASIACSRHLRNGLPPASFRSQWFPRAIWDVISAMTTLEDENTSRLLGNTPLIESMRGRFSSRLQVFRNEASRSEISESVVMVQAQQNYITRQAIRMREKKSFESTENRSWVYCNDDDSQYSGLQWSNEQSKEPGTPLASNITLKPGPRNNSDWMGLISQEESTHSRDICPDCELRDCCTSPFEYSEPLIAKQWLPSLVQ